MRTQLSPPCFLRHLDRNPFRTQARARAPPYCAAAFYIWTYEPPRTLWSSLGSVGLVVIVMAACLFPMAPYKIKLGVFYCSLSLLARSRPSQPE